MNDSIGVANALPFQGDFARVVGYPGRRFATLPRRSAVGCECVSPLSSQNRQHRFTRPYYAERHAIDVGKAEGARGRRCRARIDTLFGDSDVVVRSGNVVTPSLAKKPSATLEQMRRSNGFARRRRPFFGRLLSFQSKIGINFRFYLNYFTGPPKRERSAIFSLYSGIMSHSLPKAYRSAIDLAGQSSGIRRRRIDIRKSDGFNTLVLGIPLHAVRLVILLFRYFWRGATR